MHSETIAEIVAFWLGPALDGPEIAFARRDWWYKGGPAVDAEIGERFSGQVRDACDGAYDDWAATPDGALAMILLLDQFTRNLYRHTPQAYAGDARAFDIVDRAIAAGLDRDLHPVCRIWLYHPFHHSEDIAAQERGSALLEEVKAAAAAEWHPFVDRSIWGWARHRDIVRRFSRFPHRNQVLGRESTPEELEFLATNTEAFGQGAQQDAGARAGTA